MYIFSYIIDFLAEYVWTELNSFSVRQKFVSLFLILFYTFLFPFFLLAEMSHGHKNEMNLATAIIISMLQWECNIRILINSSVDIFVFYLVVLRKTHAHIDTTCRFASHETFISAMCVCVLCVYYYYACNFIDFFFPSLIQMYSMYSFHGKVVQPEKILLSFLRFPFSLLSLVVIFSFAHICQIEYASMRSQWRRI